MIGTVFSKEKLDEDISMLQYFVLMGCEQVRVKEL